MKCPAILGLDFLPELPVSHIAVFSDDFSPKLYTSIGEL